MPTATLTTKGQITIPSEVRTRLGLRPGDPVSFVFERDGTVSLHTKKVPFERLRGILKSPLKKPLTIRQMDDAISRTLVEKHARIARESSK